MVPINVNWNAVIKVGGYVVAGLATAAGTIKDMKQTETVTELVERVAELEKLVKK